MLKLHKTPELSAEVLYIADFFLFTISYTLAPSLLTVLSNEQEDL
jgi:hypothetical protein